MEQCTLRVGSIWTVFQLCYRLYVGDVEFLEPIYTGTGKAGQESPAWNLLYCVGICAWVVQNLLYCVGICAWVVQNLLYCVGICAWVVQNLLYCVGICAWVVQNLLYCVGICAWVVQQLTHMYIHVHKYSAHTSNGTRGSVSLNTYSTVHVLYA